jgi:cell division protein FtsB
MKTNKCFIVIMAIVLAVLAGLQAKSYVDQKDEIANLKAENNIQVQQIDQLKADKSFLETRLEDMENDLFISDGNFVIAKDQVDVLTAENSNLTAENAELLQQIKEFQTVPQIEPTLAGKSNPKQP